MAQADVVLPVLLWLSFWLVPILAAFVALYLLFSLPLQRRERARIFLDLLETLLRQGRPLEESLVAIAQTHDRALGVRFHLFAAHLERGVSFREALARVPRFLPPAVTAMLSSGDSMGDLARVLPACRRTIEDAVSETRSAVNYLVVLAFVVTPITALMPLFLFQFILPKYREVLQGMMGSELPWFLSLVSHLQPLLTAFLILLMIVLWVGGLAYVGGPRFIAWLQAGIPRILDAAALRLPWRRKRMQRDFCAMLALLLDGGVPEADALRMAADCTANEVFRARVERGIRQLKEGGGLEEALRTVDRSGEFHWRRANAARARGGFMRALRGWQEALDAKAYQEEQAMAHGLSTSLVVLNGLLLGGVMVVLFGSLVAIIEAGVLW